MFFAMQQMRGKRVVKQMAMPPSWWRLGIGEPMDPKLTILFMLIGGIIVLSHLGDGGLSRMRRQFSGRNWRGLVPGRRRL